MIIYYAGHGYYSEDDDQGYWIPADGDTENSDAWISNQEINTLISKIDAASIFIISDSCYSGSILNENSKTKIQEKPNEQKIVVALTSGGLEPVLDDGGYGHSCFAFELLNILRGIPESSFISTVHEIIQKRVQLKAPQSPQFGGLEDLGHQEGKDFILSTRIQE